MNKKVRGILALLLPVQYLVFLGVKQFPGFIEKYYSQGFFPVYSKLNRMAFGWIPFSIGDIFYTLIIIAAIVWLYKNFRKFFSEPVLMIADLLARISVIYFFFHMIWGFNYHRQPLYKNLNIDKSYTTEELVAVTKRLIDKSNELHRKLGYADSTKIDLPYSQKEIFDKSIEGYKNLEKVHPELGYSNLSLKKSSYSLFLTYMGYSGYYNPLTGEAQVNSKIKTYKFPVVSCHEQAHQLGYAAENEANFIATLATLHNEDPYIKYTGYIFSLRYCINEIARRDMTQYEELLPTINYGILESYKEMREFWKSYENPFEDISKLFWDQFLKANDQKKGIMSYSYMVALVVNYFEDRPL